ncbi:unnamed protein product [Meloidogyne enterolobii]|uniref:Uncharacterized protein n=1 Tax=Meloidogyne enterolobii TaxID=390850 RepID=A0ACB0Z8D8_MELEN
MLLFSVRNFSTSRISRASALKEVFILDACRTPIGSFRSQLASLPAPSLASVCIKELIKRTNIPAKEIQEVFLGQVCQANVGQAPARQAALGAGLDVGVAVTTINKVCSSGLKSIMLAAQQIQTGHQNIVIGGGMESMSQVPYYLERGELPYGGAKLIVFLFFYTKIKFSVILWNSEFFPQNFVHDLIFFNFSTTLKNFGCSLVEGLHRTGTNDMSMDSSRRAESNGTTLQVRKCLWTEI